MGTLAAWSSVAPAFAAEVTIKASLLLLLAGGASALLGRGSAAARHLLWSLAVGGAVALPIVAASLPWSLPVLPRHLYHVAEGLAPSSAEAGERTPSARLEEPGSPAAPDVGPSLPSARVSVGAATGSQGGELALAGPAVVPDDATASASALVELPPAASLDPAPGPPGPAAAQPQASPPPSARRFAPDRLALVVWAVGAGLLLLHQLAGMLVLGGLARGADPVREPATLRVLERLSGTLGIRRSVHLRRSRKIRVPMTWGVARPVILLPDSSRGWSQERTRVVLKHELAHVRRLDALTLAVGRLGTALHWFNPLMWWALRRLRSEGERAADDCVLSHGERASEYAGHLLDLVSQMGRPRAPAGALPLAEPSRLEDRLVAILKPGIERGGVRRPTVFAEATCALAAVLLLAAAAPAPAAVAAGPASMAPESASVPPESAAIAPESAGAEWGPVAEPSRDRADGGTRAERVESPPARAPVDPASLADVTGPTAQVAPPQAVPAAPREVAPERQAQDARAVQALIGALREDADPEVRRTAAWSLGQLEDSMATTALGEALVRDESVDVRRVVAWAMGQIEDPAAVPPLGAALNDMDVDVRRTAVWALGQIEAQESVGALSQALSDSDPEVRAMAAWALGQIGTPAIVAALASAVADADPSVREQTVWALGQVRSPDVVPALARALEDTTTTVRRQAAWALGQSRSAAAVPVLSTTLRQDPDAGVREQAAWALGQVDAPEAVPALAAALADEAPRVGELAAWALGRISPEVSPTELLTVATSGTGELRLTALWALTEIGDPAALPVLVEALRDSDAEVRTLALNALVDFEDAAAIDAIAELLQDADPQVRAAAARALAGSRVSGFSAPRPRPGPQPQPRPRPVPPPRPDGG